MSIDGELSALAIHDVGDAHVASSTHDVLSYWFPSRKQSLDHVYKKKWFASDDTLAAVDTEIRTNFSELLHVVEKLNTRGKSTSSEDVLRSQSSHRAQARWSSSLTNSAVTSTGTMLTAMRRLKSMTL
jgi:hypothetical protein